MTLNDKFNNLKMLSFYFNNYQFKLKFHEKDIFMKIFHNL